MSSVLYQNNPCRDCKPPERHAGCHAECEKHKEWREEVDRRKNQFYSNMQQDVQVSNYQKHTSRKIKKKYGGKKA